jgi:hypothetical protein
MKTATIATVLSLAFLSAGIAAVVVPASDTLVEARPEDIVESSLKETVHEMAQGGVILLAGEGSRVRRRDM